VEAIFHKTTASKIIKSQNRIVRTVEFTVLPHPLTGNLSNALTATAITCLDAVAKPVYAGCKFGLLELGLLTSAANEIV
jgi:hypothetical protein